MTRRHQSANRAERQQHTAADVARQRLLARQALLKAQQAALSDPYEHWQQLLIEERHLQKLESLMTVVNVRWSHSVWSQLHDRSERLASDMAACIKRMEARQ